MQFTFLLFTATHMVLFHVQHLLDGPFTLYERQEKIKKTDL